MDVPLNVHVDVVVYATRTFMCLIACIPTHVLALVFLHLSMPVSVSLSMSLSRCMRAAE